MNESDFLASQFEQNRGHLRAIAYRMLGSLSEADDAVQEAWLKLSRANASTVENLGGWLTTVVARICLDMLRSRDARREDSLDELAESMPDHADVTVDQEILLAESMSSALLIVLETLSPPERLAFVLHDLFAVPFDEIAQILGRSPVAARQLASRARRRVQGQTAASLPKEDRVPNREIVDAFLAASRNGDFEALLALLDPDVVMRVDAAA